MAIDSIYDKDHADNYTVSFPFLGKCEDSTLIVLFTAPQVGTVVKAGTVHELGLHSKSWDMPSFTPLAEGEKVVLKNKWERTNGDA